MNITVEISMYPLDADYKPPIKAFVRRLREHPGLETRTNQMSTQVRGEFDAVMGAVNACMKQSMADNEFNLEGFDDQIRSEIARLESIYNEKSPPNRQNEYWSWPPTK